MAGNQAANHSLTVSNTIRMMFINTTVVLRCALILIGDVKQGGFISSVTELSSTLSSTGKR